MRFGHHLIINLFNTGEHFDFLYQGEFRILPRKLWGAFFVLSDNQRISKKLLSINFGQNILYIIEYQ